MGFFGRKKKEKRSRKVSGDASVQSPSRLDQRPEEGNYFGLGHTIHDIRDIDLPLPPRSGSAMSSRSYARTQPYSPSHNARGGAMGQLREHPEHRSAAGPYSNYSPSPSLRSPASNESPWGSRPGTSSDRSRGLVIPESQPRRDHVAPRSPLAQSHNVNGHMLREPSPLSDWHPGSSTGISPLSSHFPAEDHRSARGYLPSPPASGSRAEFKKPSRENLGHQGPAYRGPPAGNALRLAGGGELRNGPAGTPTHSGPAPLPSPALSGMGGYERDESDDDALGSPVVPVMRTVGAHRDTLQIMGARQPSVRANIENPRGSPLAGFKFTHDDEKALSNATRTSDPVEFSEMNRAHKPLPLVLQKQPSPGPQIPEGRVPDRMASPLASPPANRAAAGLGVCGSWPLGSDELPGGSQPPSQPPPQAGFPLEDPRNRRMGPPGGPEGHGGMRGPMPGNRGYPAHEDMRGVRGPPSDGMRSPEGRRQGPMGHGHAQAGHQNTPAVMRPGPPGTYSGPPAATPPGSHRGPPPGSPMGPHPGAHGAPRHPQGNTSPGSYRGLPGTGRPPITGHNTTPQPNHLPGPVSTHDSSHGHGWARPTGATPPPRGPTGTPGPRGPLRQKESARARPPVPGGPTGHPLQGVRTQHEFPLPPGYSGGGPVVIPPPPPGTPGLDAARRAPPIRTRNGTPAPKNTPVPRKHDPLPPPPRGTTPTLRGPPASAPPPNRAPSPPRGMTQKRTPEHQVRPQQSAPELDFAFNFPVAPRAQPPQSEPSPPKFTCPRPAPPSPAPGASRPAHMDNPNWPLAAPLPTPTMSPPPNKALPPPPHRHGNGWEGSPEAEWPGPRQNPMTNQAAWGPMVR